MVICWSQLTAITVRVSILKGLPSVSRIPVGKSTHPRVQPTVRSQLSATTVRVNQALYIADLLHLRVHRQLFYNAGSLV
jgi:hypothetical protein